MSHDRNAPPGYAPGMNTTPGGRRLAALCGTLATLYMLAAPAEAHRDGCHRWHSCPSDSGSYVCGDLGYTTYCGTSAATTIPAAPAASAPPAPSGNTRYTTAAVNLRGSPSTQGAKLATLIKGSKVNLILCGNSWCRVTWQGRTGYVAQAYLRR